MGRRKVILVVPPQRGLLEGFSAGLISLGNYIRLCDSAVVLELLDLSHTPLSQIRPLVARAVSGRINPTFVAITTTTASYQSALQTAVAFKSEDPECRVVLGGHHVSPQAETVLRRHMGIVDFVIRGEGEVAFTSLLRQYPNFDHVPNLSYLQSGKIIHNPYAPRLKQEDLDRIHPLWNGEMPSQSVPGKFDHVTYVSARGCPLLCKFCAVRGTKVVAKSISAVIADLRHLVSELGYKNIAIEDNFFGHEPQRTIDLCKAIQSLRSELEFFWDCQTRVESMARPEVVKSMAAAGCEAAYLGVESVVPRQLLYLGKSFRPDRYLQLLMERSAPSMLAAGMNVYINIQLGVPDETESERLQTLIALEYLGALAVKHSRKITVFPQLHVLYPGTAHFDTAVNAGVFGQMGHEVFEEFTAWEAAEEPVLHYLGEHFAHGVGGIPIGILDDAALRAGRFEIFREAILEMSTHLSEMSEVPGVDVFKYGRYLTRPSAEESHADQVKYA